LTTVIVLPFPLESVAQESPLPLVEKYMDGAEPVGVSPVAPPQYCLADHRTYRHHQPHDPDYLRN
jgi:hypothetical protein